MHSENSKTSDPHRLFFNLSDKISLKRSNKYVALPNLNIYYTCEKYKKVKPNNKCKKSVPTRNKKFELPDGSYSVSDIHEVSIFISIS